MKLIITLFYACCCLVLFGQYCTTGGPTSTADSNVEQVQLTGSSGSINFNGCPGVIGLQDLTSTMSTTLTAGNNYNLFVKFGTCGGNFTGVGEAFIDFNGDAVFSPNESIGTWSGIPPAVGVNMPFNVPVSVLSGPTRMRIIQHEAGTLPLDPCASFTWGSMMDFGIVFTGGVDCSSYLGDTKEDAIPVTTLPYTNTGDLSYCYFNQNLVYSSPDIYYRIIPNQLISSATISLCGSNFDTFLSVVDQDGTIVDYNDDGTCGTASELTVSLVGIDTAYVIVEGWGNATGVFTISINATYVGLDEQNTTNLTVFPNPGQERVNISTPFTGTLQLVDLSGNVVKQQICYLEKEFSTTDLTPGIYFLRFSNGTEQTTIKWIKTL